MQRLNGNFIMYYTRRIYFNLTAVSLAPYVSGPYPFSQRGDAHFVLLVPALHRLCPGSRRRGVPLPWILLADDPGSTVNSPSPSRKSTGSSCCLAHRVNFNNQPFPVEEIGRYGSMPGASDGPLKPLSPSRKSAAYLGFKTF